jgi:hypothetical protein
MKLNFWQWVGVIVVGIALIVIVRREFGDRKTPPNPAPNFSPVRAEPGSATQPTP